MFGKGIGRRALVGGCRFVDYFEAELIEGIVECAPSSDGIPALALSDASLDTYLAREFFKVALLRFVFQTQEFLLFC
jgi:hypothetical protein